MKLQHFLFIVKICIMLLLSCYLLSISIPLLGFIVSAWITGVGLGSSGWGCSQYTKPFPLLRKEGTAKISLFAFSWCVGMRWNQSRRMKAPKLPVSSCFPQQRFFFPFPKDDASFQGVFNLQTVSSVYFTVVKCAPLRSNLSAKTQPVPFSGGSCFSKRTKWSIKAL